MPGETNYESLFHGACQFGEASSEAAVHYANKTRELRRDNFSLRGTMEMAVRELEKGRPSRALSILKLRLERSEHDQTKGNNDANLRNVRRLGRSQRGAVAAPPDGDT